jgi:gas vesicle protein
MERYKQRFSGAFAQLIKSNTGKWVKHAEFEDILKSNEDALFDVIKERNADIEMHKQCIEELNVLISKVNRWREEDLKEHQSESMQNFEELQRLGDDLEYLKNWNTKLFSLLVISTVLNFIMFGIAALYVG